MQVLMTALGTVGDLHPVLGLGTAIAERGHSVGVMTLPCFEEHVTGAGLKFLGMPWDETLVQSTLESTWSAFLKDFGVDISGIDIIGSILDPAVKRDFLKRAGSVVEREVLDESAFLRWLWHQPQYLKLIRTVPRATYRLVEENHLPGDTIWLSLLWHSFGVGKVVQDKLNIPFALMWINAMEFRFVQPILSSGLSGLEDGLKNAILRPFIGSAIKDLSELRSDLGLTKDKNLIRAWCYSQGLNIALFPRWFVPWFRGKLPNCVMPGFALYQRSRALPRELEDFLSEGERPVVFGNASWQVFLRERISASIAACESLGVRGVFVSDVARNLVPTSKNFIAVDYADYQTLLPRAAAVAHHAGIGSVAASLASGTPQLAVPAMNDQGFNARTMEKLGTGLVVDSKRYEKLVKLRLSELLGRDDIRQNCRDYAERLETGPDYGTAIDGLEALLAGARRTM